MKDPKNTAEVPELSPEKRGSLWNACYAAAFVDEWRALYTVSWQVGKGIDLDKFVEHRALGTAEEAKTLADIAVWALGRWEKENT